MNRRGMWGMAMVAVLLAMAAGAAEAQQKEKKTKPEAARVEEQQQRGNEADIIDYLISEMLAAWQIGDATLLRNYYADEVVVVSGVYEPPLVGWASYAQAYKEQRARIQAVQLNRRNTFTVVRGNTAWSTYQWEFVATVDNAATSARGHTTLVLEKRGAKWLIVHNHTSLVTEQPAPAQKPGGGK